MAKRYDRPIVHKGAECTISCAVCRDGSSPAQEFLDSLDDADKRKLEHLFRMMGTQGRISNEQKFKLLERPLWEFKSYQIRIPCFQDVNEWVLTHGITKKDSRAKKKNIKKARRIMNEDLERLAEQ